MFVNVSEGRERQSAEQEPTNEFLAAVGLDDLYNTGTKSFNRGNVIWKDAHFPRFGRNIYLNYILGVEESLVELDEQLQLR